MAQVANNFFENLNDRKLAPWIRRLVDSLEKSSSKFRNDPLVITEIQSSAPLYVLLTEGYDKCDRFVVNLPYGDGVLGCSISFIYNNEELEPWFAFDDGAFVPDLSNLHSYLNWDVRDPDALLNLILELLQEYKRYKLSICNNHERLKLELETLNEGIYKDHPIDMDVLIENHEAIFVCHLRAEGVTSLPEVFLANSTVDDRVVLKLKYKNMGEDMATAELMLSPFLNQLFGLKTGPTLPRFECFMAEYIERVQEMLDESVRDIKEMYEARRRFILSLRSFFRKTLNGDFVLWTCFSCLVDVKYVLKVHLSERFPSGYVDIQFISTSVERAGENPQMENTRLKVAADKTETQLAEELRKFVETILIPKFQRSNSHGDS